MYAMPGRQDGEDNHDRNGTTMILWAIAGGLLVLGGLAHALASKSREPEQQRPDASKRPDPLPVEDHQPGRRTPRTRGGPQSFKVMWKPRWQPGEIPISR